MQLSKGDMKMKKNLAYEAPEAIVVSLESVDVITASIFLDSDVLEDGWIGV